MKRKIFIIIMVILVLVVGNLMVFLNSNYYYSKKLVLAIKEENVIAVQQIVEKKPNCINTYPSITSKWWQSAMNQRVCYPLNAACDTGNLDIIKLLIENGADVNCNDGLTPLSITYSSKVDNWYVISQILIKNGASLNYTTEYSGGKSSVLQDIVQNRPGSSLPGYEPDNGNLQQGLKNGRFIVGVSFGGKNIYMARQKDGFAITKYKRLRLEFIDIMNLQNINK